MRTTEATKFALGFVGLKKLPNGRALVLPQNSECTPHSSAEFGAALHSTLRCRNLECYSSTTLANWSGSPECTPAKYWVENFE